MSQHAHRLIGIIELTPSPSGASGAIDDSSLERLLASFADRDSLEDDRAILATTTRQNDCRSEVGGLRRDRGATVAANVESLLSDLEREYAELCAAANL